MSDGAKQVSEGKGVGGGRYMHQVVGIHLWVETIDSRCERN